MRERDRSARWRWRRLVWGVVGVAMRGGHMYMAVDSQWDLEVQMQR